MKKNDTEILEDLTTAINKFIFWREFTFNKNKFKLSNGDNAELADNVVWLDDTLFIFQTKQRNILNGDDIFKNDKWYQDEVLKKGSKQIRDTLSFLEIHGDKQISNLCGLPFRVENIKGNSLHKLILYGIDPLLSTHYKYQKCKISLKPVDPCRFHQQSALEHPALKRIGPDAVHAVPMPFSRVNHQRVRDVGRLAGI
jgi:hypothetical protein